MRRFLIVFSALVAGVSLLALLIPEGEVVKLHTFADDGRAHASALWVVDLPGGLYLRSGDPRSAWLRRIATHPLVELERNDTRGHFRAVPVEDPVVRSAVNEAMARKYGSADRLVRRFIEVERSVPIRLEEVPGLAPASLH